MTGTLFAFAIMFAMSSQTYGQGFGIGTFNQGFGGYGTGFGIRIGPSYGYNQLGYGNYGSYRGLGYGGYSNPYGRYNFGYGNYGRGVIINPRINTYRYRGNGFYSSGRRGYGNIGRRGRYYR